MDLHRLLIITLLISASISIPISLIKYNPVTSQGQLTIHRKNKTIRKLFVKSIETTQWIAEQNFMYKTSMPDTCGMLFLYHHEAELSFRIKKYHSPFDIIFVAPDNRITIIEKNVSPFTTQVPVYNNQVLYHYILVVNAGFCNRHSIMQDDSVSFILENNTTSKIEEEI